MLQTPHNAGIYFYLSLLKRGEKGLKENYGLAAQDACCACGGGNYVCDKYQYLYGSFYGRCNCTYGYIWSGEDKRCVRKSSNCLEARGSICGSCKEPY